MGFWRIIEVFYKGRQDFIGLSRILDVLAGFSRTLEWEILARFCGILEDNRGLVF